MHPSMVEDITSIRKEITSTLEYGSPEWVNHNILPILFFFPI